MYDWLSEGVTDIIDHVARLEAVDAVRDDVIWTKDVHCVIDCERAVVFLDTDVRIDRRQARMGCLDLGSANAMRIVEQLSIQVAVFDDVKVDQTDLTYTS